MALKEGDKAPAFTAETDEGTISLKDLKGQNVILYFYPKDNTPGCTKEACGFRDNLNKFKRAQAAVFGVSRDSIEKHKKFREKYDLTFPLISDEDGKICESYGVWKEKKFMGKKYMGIERSTFLIDSNGVIRKIWRAVKVAGHVDEVLTESKNIK